MSDIFIEGLPAAGKTSLIKLLENEGYSVVHELGRVLPKIVFPGDGKNLDQMLEINEWFIEQESNRFIDNYNKIYDRSYLTHFSYAYAYSNLMDIPGFISTLNQYEKALLSKKLILPDLMIYLDISPEKSIERQIMRTKKGEQHELPRFWRDVGFLQDLKISDYALIKSLNNIDVITLSADDLTENKYSQIKPYLNYKRNDKNIDLEKYKLLLGY